VRPTVRLRLTLLYAWIVFLAGLLLLSVSYVLVRNSLGADHRVSLAPFDPIRQELERAVQDELAADALDRLRVQYVIALGAITALSLLLGWIVAGHVLRPLQRITATAKRVSEDTLDERIALQGPRDELRELADTFDGMLERLSHTFRGQRRFVANASHELRTPLTVMRTELEVALADPDATAEELRETAEVVRAAVYRTERLIEALLLLARSEGGAVRRHDRADLAGAARTALDNVAGEVAERGLRVTLDARPAPIEGDRRLLERLVANLVENAVRHNVAGGWLEVDTGLAGGRAVARVANGGRPIPPEQVAGLFEPFRRLGGDRTGSDRGAGLGLSIVRSVAAAHGGTASARAIPGGGLEVTVEVPAARP